MKNFTTFKTWYSSIKENEVATAVASDISMDVDTIINSLETLANELTEELNSMPIEEGEVGDFIASWITSMRASSAQKKVNKIRMNSADLEFAAKKAEGDKRTSLEDKSDAVKTQASELQKMVDDRFRGKGAIVDRKLAKAKIEGQLELIKRTSGMEDDPDRKSDLKTKMKELADRYREEEAAISKLEDDNKEEIEAEKERLRQEAENKKKTTKEEPAKEEPAKEEPAKEEPAKEEPVDEDPKISKAKEEIKKYQDAIDALNAKDKKTKEDDDKISMLRSAIAAQQKSIDKVQNPQESLFLAAFENNLIEVADEILLKQDWQFENNSALYKKYNEIIKKSEYAAKLNEGYMNGSIKEKFFKLL
jgi:hypothetical protein